MNKEKVKKASIWFLRGILGLEFVLAGQAKFTRMDTWAQMFERWGYPDHLYLLVGGLEIIAAICLFIPKTVLKAAIVLGVIMIAATLTHILYLEWNRSMITFILAALLGLLAWLQKKNI